MQIYLNTYSTYLHVKDDMFEIRVPVKDAEPEKKPIAAHKIFYYNVYICSVKYRCSEACPDQ